MEKYVSVEVIRAEVKKGNTKALAKLLEEMEEVKQGQARFENVEIARNSIECIDCFKVVGIKRETEEGVLPEIHERLTDGRCHSCHRDFVSKERARKEKEVLKSNFMALTDELNEIEKVYELIFPKMGQFNSDFFIKRTDCNFKIYRDSIYSRGYYRVSDHALRISTGEHDVSGNKLKKDFGGKNLAKGLHKKCEDMKEIIDARENRKLQKRKETTEVIEIIAKEFKMKVDEIECVRYYYHRGRSSVRIFVQKGFSQNCKRRDLRSVRHSRDLYCQWNQIFSEVSGGIKDGNPA